MGFRTETHNKQTMGHVSPSAERHLTVTVIKAHGLQVPFNTIEQLNVTSDDLDDDDTQQTH